jgi:DNA-binding FadR family transcriptional regulator
MADDLNQTGRQDDQRIDQDHELSYWSEKLGVSRDRLREAVAKVRRQG